MGLPCFVLWLFYRDQCLAILVQPWAAPGTHEPEPTRPKRMGQSNFSVVPDLPICLAGLHIFRCRSLSPVTCIHLVSRNWSSAAAWCFLSLFPDVPGKFIFVYSGPYSKGTR